MSAVSPIHSFAAARRGAIAVNFAILLLPLGFAMGLAVDYTRATIVRDKLQAAADSAAVAALAPDVSDERKQAVASDVFLNSLDAQTLGLLATTPTVSLTTSAPDSTGRVEIQVHFKANLKTAFASLMGFDEMSAEGFSEARTGIKQYIDVHVLMDTSDSMGLAAGEDGRLALRHATAQYKINAKETAAPGSPTENLLYFDSEDSIWFDDYYVAYDASSKGYVGCEFACHLVTNSVPKSTLQIAREAGVDLRIDVARRGIMQVADLADAAKANDSYIRMGLSVFSTTLEHVLPVTDDLGHFKSEVAKTSTFDIGSAATPSWDELNAIGSFYPLGWNWCWYTMGNTFFDYIAPQYADWLNDYRNSAMSPDADYRMPYQVVILVTDGLKSQNCAASRSKEEVYPFRPMDCNLIKATGARLAIIYTTYSVEPLSTYLGHAKFAVEADQNYPYVGAGKSSGVLENMKACASPGLFATGDNEAEIQAAFSQIFENIKVTTYLSN
jgi:Flp pilus assembly protein TadG